MLSHWIACRRIDMARPIMSTTWNMTCAANVITLNNMKNHEKSWTKWTTRVHECDKGTLNSWILYAQKVCLRQHICQCGIHSEHVTSRIITILPNIRCAANSIGVWKKCHPSIAMAWQQQMLESMTGRCRHIRRVTIYNFSWKCKAMSQIDITTYSMDWQTWCTRFQHEQVESKVWTNLLW